MRGGVDLNRMERKLLDDVLAVRGATTRREVGEAGLMAGMHNTKTVDQWGLRLLRRAVRQGVVVDVSGSRRQGVYARPGAPISPATALRYGIAGTAKLRTEARRRIGGGLLEAMKQSIRLADWLEAEDQLGPQRVDCTTDVHVAQAVELLHLVARNVAEAMGALDLVLGRAGRGHA